MSDGTWPIMKIRKANADGYYIVQLNGLHEMTVSEAVLKNAGVEVPLDYSDLQHALNAIGYDDDRIHTIARDGAYWQDADPLVKACRKVVRGIWWNQDG
jgi:hypothetical protein